MLTIRAAVLAGLLSLGMAPHSVRADTAIENAEAAEDAQAAFGFIGTRADPLIRAADGTLVWDLDAYAFVDGAAPATVHPNLWRQVKRLKRHGLFKVRDRVYQVRGFDAANMTVIEGKRGFILIDPLTFTETAAEALALARRHLGDKPVTAVIYTHTHWDHFGGAAGVISDGDARSGKVTVIAPDGFVEWVFAEQVLAGNAMGRRAQFQSGNRLERSATALMTNGIGLGYGAGHTSLIAPNRVIRSTGERLRVDGVDIEFHLTPETEAPAEMNLYFPQLRTLAMGETANATMHNLLPPRGATVRDSKAWAASLDDADERFGARSEVAILTHTWPRIGNASVRAFLAGHADLYRFLHDQTLRMMNNGLNGAEIAEAFAVHPALAAMPFNHGYYGALKFNIRAIYQRYLGWYDGNPARLDALPPNEASRRYVAALGGAQKTIDLARAAIDQGDLRWAAELLNHVVMTQADSRTARDLLAQTYTRMAYAFENAVWRSMYLMAARELLEGPLAGNLMAGSKTGLAQASSTANIADLLAVRLDPARAGDSALAIRFVFPERKEDVVFTVRNAVLRMKPFAGQSVDATVTTPRRVFMSLLVAGGKMAPERPLDISGDRDAVQRFLTFFPAPDASFPLVTPRAAN